MSNGQVNQKLKIGDIVRLKSGGPLMTVSSFKDDQVYCRWFAGEYDKVYIDYFLPDTLQLVVKIHKEGTEEHLLNKKRLKKK